MEMFSYKWEGIRVSRKNIHLLNPSLLENNRSVVFQQKDFPIFSFSNSSKIGEVSDKENYGKKYTLWNTFFYIIFCGDIFSQEQTAPWRNTVVRFLSKLSLHFQTKSAT